MKSKITIVDINLDVSVQDLINKEVEIFTGDTKRLVEKMIDERKHVQATKNKVEEEKRRSATVLESIFADLEKAADGGLPVAEIWERAKEVVSTPSAFTLKIKNMITSKGLTKMFIRAKVNKVEHYVLR
jgi:hypothetical protein